MDKRKLRDFEQKLLQKHGELTADFSRSKQAGLNDSDEGTEDYVDYAVKSYTKEFLLSLSDMERRVLQLVEDALSRLRRGDFGQCQECGEVIGEKRLEAIPWTPYCIECQEQQERATAASSR